MELYLRWLDKYKRHADSENTPIGLILCAEKNEEQIELLQLNEGEIRVAEYLTALPARSVLEAKLHDAVLRARQWLETHLEEDSMAAARYLNSSRATLPLRIGVAKDGSARPISPMHGPKSGILPRRQRLTDYRNARFHAHSVIPLANGRASCCSEREGFIQAA